MAILGLSALGLLEAAGCTYNDAELHCRREGGFTDDALEACIDGAKNIRPATLQAADDDCRARYTEACKHLPAPAAEDAPCRAHDLNSIPFAPGTAEWADRAEQMTRQFEGCHTGALAYLMTYGAVPVDAAGQ